MNLWMKARVLGLVVAGVAILIASTGSASASTLLLSYSQTTTGITGTGSISVLPNPGSAFYGNTFSSPSPGIIPGSVTPATPDGSGFFDNYVFTITAGQVDSITSAIDLGSLLGFSNIQVRLYDTVGNGFLPVIGSPAGGSIEGWSSAVNYSPGVTGLFAVIAPTALAAGTYVLQVRGTVTGSAGGSYSGTFNVTPVPLPAALWLLGSGVFGIIGFGRRTKLFNCAAQVCV